MEISQHITNNSNQVSTKDSAPKPLEAGKLGEYLRETRKAKGWTISKAAEKAGIATSSLSKIENNLMSPTYDLLIKLANGYQVDLASFFKSSSPSEQKTTARMSITRAADASTHITPNYTHQVHATGLSNKQMMPFISDVNPLSSDEEVELSAHAGEEYIYVISGEITFYTEYYEPVILSIGDSLYIDSSMKHGAVSNINEPSKVVWMASNF